MQKITILLVFVLSMLTHYSFSQKTDSIKHNFDFKGAVAVTNNGISLIPSLSLEKPAAIFGLAMSKGKLSFEPEFRFSLRGKPWSFLFWWRYQLVRNNKFAIRFGIHPAISFKPMTVLSNGVSRELTVARRYVAAELVPSYFLTKKISVGMYYLYSRGVDIGTTKSNHFLTVNANFSNIKLGDRFFMQAIPQLYYLKLDKQDGFYFTSTFNLVNKNFPIAIQSIINKPIKTNITAGKKFVWNISLIYSFSKHYVEK